jgi:large subunit ribosomal protein L15
MKLNELSPKEGSVKKAIRVGRGIGSGKGKTSAKGQKGQKSRSGVAIKGFEGGQMPLYQRLPKRGFNVHKPNRYAVLNIGKIQKAVDEKKLDTKGTLDEAALVKAGLVRRSLDGVRLLAKGELKTKLDLKVTGASKAAQEAVEKAGGKVQFMTVEERRAVKKDATAEKPVAKAKAAPKAEAVKKPAAKKPAAKKAPAKKAAPKKDK